MGGGTVPDSRRIFGRIAGREGPARNAGNRRCRCRATSSLQDAGWRARRSLLQPFRVHMAAEAGPSLPHIGHLVHAETISATSSSHRVCPEAFCNPRADDETKGDTVRRFRDLRQMARNGGLYWAAMLLRWQCGRNRSLGHRPGDSRAPSSPARSLFRPRARAR